MNLNLAIYEMFYEGAKKDGMIWTLQDYVESKNLLMPPGRDDPYSNPEIEKHGDALKTVMTLEITIYVFRRLNGTWGEVIDELRRQRSNFKAQYARETGYHIHTGNEQVYE